MPQVIARFSNRRRAIIGSVVFLGLLGLTFWAVDGWLLVRLRIIASDTFAANAMHPELLHEDADELRLIPANRLSRFLIAPSSQIRSVVCLSLADRAFNAKAGAEKPNSAEWVRVAERLLKTAQEDSVEVVRSCAVRALRELPVVPNEDVDSLFAFASALKPKEGIEALSLCAIVLSKLAKWHPDQMPRIIALLERWSSSDDPQARREGFSSLVALAPDALETLAIFRKAMEAGDPDRIGNSTWMLKHRPELIDEFLRGNAAQRRLLRQPAFQQASDMRFRQRNGPPPKIIFSEKQLQSIDPDYERLLSPQSASEEFTTACRYFQYRSGGHTVLLTKARHIAGAARVTLINHSNGLFGGAISPAPFIPDMLQWLNDKDERVQAAAERFLFAMLERKFDRPFVEAEGIRAALRIRLDASPDRVTCSQAHLFVQTAMPRDDDVDRYAAAVLRSLNEQEKFSTKNSNRYSSSEADGLKKWLTEHPRFCDRPSVKSVLNRHTELLRRGIVYQPPPAKR